jgi:hypothetical protein
MQSTTVCLLLERNDARRGIGGVKGEICQHVRSLSIASFSFLSEIISFNRRGEIPEMLEIARVSVKILCPNEDNPYDFSSCIDEAKASYILRFLYKVVLSFPSRTLIRKASE